MKTNLKTKTTSELLTYINQLEQELAFLEHELLINDMVKHNQLEEKLRQERILIENIITHSVLSTWITDETGTIIYANPASTEFFGIDHKELVGGYNIFSDDRFNRAEINSTLHQVFSTGNIGEFELEYNCEIQDYQNNKKVLKKTECLQVVPISSNLDKITHVLCQVIDLTKKKIREKDLYHHRTLLEAAINSPHNMVLLAIDLDYKYLFFNKHHYDLFKKLTGNEAEISKCIFDMIESKDGIERLKANYDRALAGETHSDQLDNPNANGRFNSYEVHYNPIYNQNNEIIGITILGFDATKRRELEIALANKQREFIEQAHKAGMADIAVDIIHDIGNVLNSIVTSTIMLKETVKHSLINKIFRANRILTNNMALYTDFILHNPKALKLVQYFIVLGKSLEYEKTYVSQIVHRLLEKVLVIKHIITAQQEFTSDGLILAKHDISDIINETLYYLKAELNQQQIIIEKKLIPLPSVPIHKTKLIQIIKNICKNAQEAMVNTPPSKRKITITTEQTENEIICKISDQGIGIKPENLEKIFSHGFTTKKGGNGFGLHSCANLMTEIGGTIIAQSQGQNTGATFCLKLILNLK